MNPLKPVSLYTDTIMRAYHDVIASDDVNTAQPHELCAAAGLPPHTFAIAVCSMIRVVLCHFKVEELDI